MKLFNKENKNFWLPSIFIAIGVIIGFLNAITPSPIKLVLSVICAFVALSVSNVKWDKKNTNYFSMLILLALIVWLFNVVSVFAQSGENPLRLATLLYMIYALVVSFILTNNRISLVPLRITFYYIAFYFYYQCVVKQISPDELFMFSTGGMMSSILFSIAIPIQFLEYRWEGKVSIIPPIIIVVLSITSISRTALICSLVYLLVNLILLSFGNKKFRFWGIFIFIGVIFFSYKWILQYWEELSSLEIYNKFEYMGMDTSAREDIWLTYIKELNFFTFFFGRNVDKTHTILGFANTHNSFIQLHSQIGILSLAFIIYFIKVCLYYIKNDIYAFGLLLVLLLRCSFDTLFFFNIYDFAIIVFLLQYKLHNKRELQSIRISLL